MHEQTQAPAYSSRNWPARIEALSGTMVFVADASDDVTVTAGWARYEFFTGPGWVKISEQENLDQALVINWTDIVGRPASTPAQIDAAVTASHSRSNLTQLNNIGQDGDGNLTYSGALPRAALPSTAW